MTYTTFEFHFTLVFMQKFIYNLILDFDEIFSTYLQNSFLSKLVNFQNDFERQSKMSLLQFNSIFKTENRGDNTFT